jgi:signal transduction histidine kinase
MRNASFHCGKALSPQETLKTTDPSHPVIPVSRLPPQDSSNRSFQVWNALIRRYGWALSVCAILLGGFLLSSIGSYLVSRENVRKTITESALPLTSDNIYSEIQRDLLQPVFISSMMAHDTFLKDWVIAGERDPDQLLRYLREIRTKYATVTSFFVSEKSRSYYHADQLLKTVSESDPRDTWYFRVREMDSPFEINVDPDMANRDEMTVFINYRVLDSQGQLLGATGVGLTVNRVHQLIQSYETRYGRHILFTNPQGEIMLDTRPGESGRPSLKDLPGLGANSSQLLEQKNTEIRYQHQGKTCFVNARFVPELGWHLIVEQNEDTLLSPLQDNLLINIGIALLTTLMVSAICLSSIRHNRKDLENHNRQLAALNQEKDEFLGVAAHDLRSPIHGIIGLSGHLGEELRASRPDLIPIVDDLQTSAEGMLQLIQTLLDVTWLESLPDQQVQLESVNWNQLARECQLRFARMAKAKNITWELDLDPLAETVVPGKKEWLLICIGNLMSNAVKYSRTHSKVWICSRMNAEGPMLSVRDSGPGLLPQDMEKLFRKFERLSAKPTAGESSTGLGLYIVAGMASRMGIRVEAANHAEGGAMFTLRSPGTSNYHLH